MRKNVSSDDIERFRNLKDNWEFFSGTIFLHLKSRILCYNSDMGFLQLHQTDLMLVLSGICAILVLFILVTKGLSRRRKSALIIMEFCASLLLFLTVMHTFLEGIRPI